MVLWSTVLHSTACIPHIWSKIGSTLICSSPLTGRIQRISGFCDDVLYKLMIDNYIDICTCVVFMFHFMLSTKWHLYRVPLIYYRWLYLALVFPYRVLQLFLWNGCRSLPYRWAYTTHTIRSSVHVWPKTFSPHRQSIPYFSVSSVSESFTFLVVQVTLVLHLLVISQRSRLHASATTGIIQQQASLISPSPWASSHWCGRLKNADWCLCYNLLHCCSPLRSNWSIPSIH